MRTTGIVISTYILSIPTNYTCGLVQLTGFQVKLAQCECIFATVSWLAVYFPGCPRC